jgi:glycosyltransferase involved in cell wall biosynthesis
MDRKKGLNTRFVGMQSNLDLYYESSDILLICSANEGTPLVTIEASRYSVPTLSSAVGSMEDLIKNHENGFLVENTLNAFVSKLIELNDNRGEMVRVGTNCEKSFKESFRKDIFLDKHVDCYLA